MARKYYTKKRRFQRRRNGKYRKRFKRKSFRKSPGFLQSGLYIPKQAFVKLNHTRFMVNEQLTGGNPWVININGNGLCSPYSIGGADPGDTFPQGLLQYSNFYEKYRVLGCSIKINFNNGGGNSTQGVGVLLAYNGVFDTGPTGNDDNYERLIASDPDSLVSYPGASWKIISTNTGNRQNAFFKGFRKSKTILGVKDMRDNDEADALLPTNVPESAQQYGTNPSASQRWSWMFKFNPFFTDTIPAATYQVTVKLKYYVQLFGRDYNEQFEVPDTQGMMKSMLNGPMSSFVDKV